MTENGLFSKAGKSIILLHIAISLSCHLGIFLKDFSLLAHFQQLLLLSWILHGLLAGAILRRIPSLAVLVAFSHAVVVLSAFQWSAGDDDKTSGGLAIAWFNTMYSPDALKTAMASIIPQNPHVIGLCEVDRHQEVLANGYRYVIRVPKYDFCLLSKTPFLDQKVHRSRGRSQVEVSIERDGEVIRLFFVHLSHPTDSVHSSEFTTLAKALGGNDKVVVVGDFNSTPWAANFHGFARKADLEMIKPKPFELNTFQGWPGGWLALPIDHFLFRGDFTSSELTLLPWTTSDHRPLIARFGFQTP